MSIQVGIYQHYKGPHYRVIGVAQHSESEEQLVVYQALYGDFGLWVRPLSMFVEQVQVQGQLQPRFTLLHAEENMFLPPKS